MKNKFVELARELEIKNFVPRLEKSFDGVDIFVTRLSKASKEVDWSVLFPISKNTLSSG